MRKIIFLLVVISVSGCSLASSVQCKKWRREGLLFSTLESCQKCIDAVGSNVDAVRGCAMGMDAATLIVPERR